MTGNNGEDSEIEVGSSLVSLVYDPYLPGASAFYRAAGFFSPTALSAASRSYALFFNGGGQLNLLIGEETNPSPKKLDPAVVRSIAAGVEARQLSAVSLVQHPNESLKALSEAGLLVIRVVQPRNGKGMFHSKFGVIELSSGDSVAFNGSANETKAALLGENHESTSLYLGGSRPAELLQEFLSIWSGDVLKWEVFGFAPALDIADRCGPAPDELLAGLPLEYSEEDCALVCQNPVWEERRLQLGMTRRDMAAAYSELLRKRLSV